MAYTLFVVEIISAFILAATLLYRYGDCYRNHILVTVSVLTAWYFSFVIMFILPLDVSSVSIVYLHVDNCIAYFKSHYTAFKTYETLPFH